MLKNAFWILIFSALFFTFNYISNKGNNSFPELENQDYIGKAFIDKKSYPLIVKNGDILALVKKNERPQRINDKAKIIINGVQHLLTGEQKKESYLGLIKLNKEKVGTWYLEKAKLNRISNKKLNQKEIHKNIKLAKNYHLTKDIKSKLERELKELKKKNKLLITALKNKDLLKNKIKNTDTKKELLKIREDNKKSIKQIEKRKSQLVQVNRISKKGRFLEFNKRTTKRENTWYLNNWTGFNNYKDELQAAKKLGISRSELRRKLKLAQNFIDIKGAIKKEKDLITNLNNSQYYYEKTINNTNTAKDHETKPLRVEGTEKAKRKKKSFWKKIGDVFR